MSETIPDYNKTNKSAADSGCDNEYLSLDIQPSVLLKTLTIFVHILFLITFFVALFPIIIDQPSWTAVVCLGVIVIAVNLFVQLRKLAREHWLLTADAENWWLSQGKDAFHTVSIVGEIILWRAFIFIAFETVATKDKPSKKFKLLLLPDSTDTDSLRQLRVKLVTHFTHYRH